MERSHGNNVKSTLFNRLSIITLIADSFFFGLLFQWKYFFFNAFAIVASYLDVLLLLILMWTWKLLHHPACDRINHPLAHSWLWCFSWWIILKSGWRFLPLVPSVKSEGSFWAGLPLCSLTTCNANSNFSLWNQHGLVSVYACKEYACAWSLYPYLAWSVSLWAAPIYGKVKVPRNHVRKMEEPISWQGS